MNRLIFVNLPVRDLDASVRFFAALGYRLDARFTDATATCMVISDSIHAMLMTHAKFATFAPGPICDARTATEVLVCLSCESRDEVDDVVRRAVAAGGTTHRPPLDYGFMYGHGFQDLDGHAWELMWMSPDAPMLQAAS